MNYSIYELLCLFLIYSFLGWCVEVSFVALTTGQVVNRGFLNGPVCPIYGVGMLGVLVLLAPVADDLPLLFLGGLLLCTAVELAGGWILEKVFHTRWWDYSDRPLNLGGYVCLSFSLMWGLAVTFVVRLVHPFLFSLVEWLPHTLGVVLLIALYGLFTADLIVTLVTIIGLKKRLGELDRVAEALSAVGDSISERLGSTALAADARLDELKDSSQERAVQHRERVSAALESSQQRIHQAKAARQQRLEASRERLEARLGETLEELMERRAMLERRQQQLAERRPGLGVRRLSHAFPAIHQIIQDRLPGPKESEKDGDSQHENMH